HAEDGIRGFHVTGVQTCALPILLARLGYRVVASTGRRSEEAYLRGLGASEILDRAELSQPGKPLQKERWAGVVDAVGSHTLANEIGRAAGRGRAPGSHGAGPPEE